MVDRYDENRQVPARYPQPVDPRYPAPHHDLFGYPGEDQDSVHLREYWRVLLVRRWTVIAVLVTVFLITAIATFKQVPEFRARTRIQIDRENPNVLPFQDVYQVESLTDDALQTQFEILASRSLARRVIEELRLVDHPEFQPAEPSALGSVAQSALNIFAGEDDAAVSEEVSEIQRAIDAYLERLTVSPVRQSRLADVSFESTDPEFATRVINAHAEHFRDQNLQFRYEATQEAAQFLEGRVGELQSQLEGAEDQLLDYSTANEIFFTEEGRSSAIENFQQVQQEYTDARADRIQKGAYQQQIEAGNTGALPQVRNNALISDLSGRLIELRREAANLAVAFLPGYPQLQRIRSQIEEFERAIEAEERRVVATVQSEYEAALERERQLEGMVADQRGVVTRVNQDMVQYDILKQEADSMQNLYDSMLAQLQEAGVSGTLRASNIRIVDRAEVPSDPVRPRKALNLAMGLIFGLTVGVGLAFFQEYMDNTIKSPDDVARYLGVPMIAAIPKRETLKGKAYGAYGRTLEDDESEEDDIGGVPAVERIEMVSADAPTSVMAEAYRSMRTSLLLSSADRPPKTVLITSAMPSEGKTVTAINMAISLTQTGGRVALVDADMRKPRVHSVFALGATPGLSALLAGSATIKEVLHKSSVPNLFIIPCGVIPPNPAELLMSNRFKHTLTSLSEYFDYVVIDSPPVSNVSDARIIGRSTDSTLLVVKAWETPRGAADQAVNSLIQARARVSGIVLNDIDVRTKGYHYSGYSGYSGQYYAAGP
jgi:capsular exopolysaccharide synthesis family protein